MTAKIHDPPLTISYIVVIKGAKQDNESDKTHLRL